MGLLDFLFKKKQPEQINFDEIETECKNVFKLGFENENELVRRISEEAIWRLNTPVGKRFLASGINEPDIYNRLFVFKKIYQRGGWRLAESIIEIAFDKNNELEINERSELLYFIGENRDPETYQYLEKGLESNDIEIRVATICAIAGISNQDALEPIKDHLEKSENELEKYCCYLVLRELNEDNAKVELDKYIENLLNEPKIEYIEKLSFLDVRKSLPYLLKITSIDNYEIKKSILNMIKDGRSIEVLKKLLQDNNIDFLGLVLEKVINLESHSSMDSLNKLEDKKDISIKLKIAKSIINSDKEAHKEVSEFFKQNNDFLDIDYYLSFLDSDYFKDIIGKKLFDYINNIETDDSISDEKIKELIIVIKLLIKLGKMNSLLIIRKFIDTSSLAENNILKWELSCYSAVAILCIIERNIVYV